MKINDLIKKALEKNASDLHIVSGLPPSMRVAGEIIIMDEDVIKPEKTKELIYPLLTEEQQKVFERDWKISFSTLIEDLAHIRVSVYYHLGQIESAIRLRALEIKKLEELGLPKIVEELTRKPNGLVLVTGATGEGKTTTLYSMIDLINREKRCKIITVEDPVEYLFTHNRSIIIQQEVGRDAKSFGTALLHILRLDPDIICIGEMRDLETISTALTAAETGHLVIGTLHTADATQTIDRIVNAFPPHEHSQVLFQLANCLQGVIAQRLLPSVDKKNRVLACEIMIATDAVRNTIRENKIQMLYSIIQSGKEAEMQTLDSALKDLYKKGMITYDTAISSARDPKYIMNK
ncbi:MAG: PilT/PilU family type 4a pilus ATPase [Elusimicrobiota bacterium]